MPVSRHGVCSFTPFGPPRGTLMTTKHDNDAKATAARQRSIQDQQDAKDEDKKEKGGEGKGSPAQTGARRHPEPPLPEQHLDKPGLEKDLELKPQFEAPMYKGSGKLEGLTALVTGGDSGIGRAVAVLFAREGADVAIVHLDEAQDAEETR